MTNYTETFKRELKHTPSIYKAFSQKAKALKKLGYERYSALALIREISAENTQRILNAHAAEYSRYFMADNPKYVGFFKTNKSKVDK